MSKYIDKEHFQISFHFNLINFRAQYLKNALCLSVPPVRVELIYPFFLERFMEKSARCGTAVQVERAVAAAAERKQSWAGPCTVKLCSSLSCSAT